MRCRRPSPRELAILHRTGRCRARGKRRVCRPCNASECAAAAVAAGAAATAPTGRSRRMRETGEPPGGARGGHAVVVERAAALRRAGRGEPHPGWRQGQVGRRRGLSPRLAPSWVSGGWGRHHTGGRAITHALRGGLRGLGRLAHGHDTLVRRHFAAAAHPRASEIAVQVTSPAVTRCAGLDSVGGCGACACHHQLYERARTSTRS
jgi:hypothetical protein